MVKGEIYNAGICYFLPMSGRKIVLAMIATALVLAAVVFRIGWREKQRRLDARLSGNAQPLSDKALRSLLD